MFYCGMDIAKRNHEASVIDAEGKPLLDSITIANTQEGCERLFSLFERLNMTKDAIIIGMEATGHYWLSVYEHLTEKKYDVRVINPIQSDAFRKMYIRQTKNDSKDSFIIAQVMRFGQYSETTLSDESTVAMRQLTAGGQLRRLQETYYRSAGSGVSRVCRPVFGHLRDNLKRIAAQLSDTG